MSWPAIWWVVPIVAMTVVSVAIPTALPSWREALNRMEVRPDAGEGIVALTIGPLELVSSARPGALRQGSDARFVMVLHGGACFAA